MGPWPGDHGNTEAAAAADAFNELQWGRGLVTTEIRETWPWPDSSIDASMGPWPGDHGNGFLTNPWTIGIGGFNGAVAW